jgi:hypothetical protein
MHASTGDARFKNRAELLVSELAKCQAALGTSGYLEIATVRLNNERPGEFFDVEYGIPQQLTAGKSQIV